MYQFCNSAPLMDLSAEGSGNQLVFSTPNERAVVVLSEAGTIASVEHTDLSTGETRTILESDCKHIVVGEKNWERDVYHYLKPNPAPHLQMRLGLTVHRGDGTWSSLPHDFENTLEPGFEEVFFYLLKGDPKKAFQVGRGVWADNAQVDTVWPIQDRVFGVVPMGYHPIVGEPGVNVSYVWAYLVKVKHWEKI
ncbi:5-deoxy-glucuronate isomerase [Roseateles sp.]|uniref:5-deoxy-glucuronate isomerase n=1 Tax=Roseateles sp. TaxID=1971397 RepID=UPI003BA4F8A1